MARVKQLADKDGELIYPVVDPTQLHFSGTNKQFIKGDGSIDNFPLCCAGVTGTATTNISSTSSWSEHNYTNLAQSKFITSNSSVFSFSNGGIKVSTAGFYVVSGEINVDSNRGKSILLRVNNSTKFTADAFMSGDMTGMALPAMVVQLSANDVVNLGYRLEDTNAHTTRGDRSQLSIVKIA